MRLGLPTERQLEILQLVALGHTNAEIGAQLYLTENTVKTHLSTLAQTLGTGNRTRLAFEAVSRGWLLPRRGRRGMEVYVPLVEELAAQQYNNNRRANLHAALEQRLTKEGAA